MGAPMKKVQPQQKKRRKSSNIEQTPCDVILRALFTPVKTKTKARQQAKAPAATVNKKKTSDKITSSKNVSKKTSSTKISNATTKKSIFSASPLLNKSIQDRTNKASAEKQRLDLVENKVQERQRMQLIEDPQLGMIVDVNDDEMSNSSTISTCSSFLKNERRMLNSVKLLWDKNDDLDDNKDDESLLFFFETNEGRKEGIAVSQDSRRMRQLQEKFYSCLGALPLVTSPLVGLFHFGGATIVFIKSKINGGTVTCFDACIDSYSLFVRNARLVQSFLTRFNTKIVIQAIHLGGGLKSILQIMIHTLKDSILSTATLVYGCRNYLTYFSWNKGSHVLKASLEDETSSLLHQHIELTISESCSVDGSHLTSHGDDDSVNKEEFEPVQKQAMVKNGTSSWENHVMMSHFYECLDSFLPRAEELGYHTNNEMVKVGRKCTSCDSDEECEVTIGTRTESGSDNEGDSVHDKETGSKSHGAYEETRTTWKSRSSLICWHVTPGGKDVQNSSFCKCLDLVFQNVAIDFRRKQLKEAKSISTSIQERDCNIIVEEHSAKMTDKGHVQSCGPPVRNEDHDRSIVQIHLSSLGNFFLTYFDTTKTCDGQEKWIQELEKDSFDSPSMACSMETAGLEEYSAVNTASSGMSGVDIYDDRNKDEDTDCARNDPIENEEKPQRDALIVIFENMCLRSHRVGHKTEESDNSNEKMFQDMLFGSYRKVDNANESCDCAEILRANLCIAIDPKTSCQQLILLWTLVIANLLLIVREILPLLWLVASLVLRLAIKGAKIGCRLVVRAISVIVDQLETSFTFACHKAAIAREFMRTTFSKIHAFSTIVWSIATNETSRKLCQSILKLVLRLLSNIVAAVLLEVIAQVIWPKHQQIHPKERSEPPNTVFHDDEVSTDFSSLDDTDGSVSSNDSIPCHSPPRMESKPNEIPNSPNTVKLEDESSTNISLDDTDGSVSSNDSVPCRSPPRLQMKLMDVAKLSNPNDHNDKDVSTNCSLEEAEAHCPTQNSDLLEEAKTDGSADGVALLEEAYASTDISVHLEEEDTSTDTDASAHHKDADGSTDGSVYLEEVDGSTVGSVYLEEADISTVGSVYLEEAEGSSEGSVYLGEKDGSTDNFVYLEDSNGSGDLEENEGSIDGSVYLGETDDFESLVKESDRSVSFEETESSVSNDSVPHDSSPRTSTSQPNVSISSSKSGVSSTSRTPVSRTTTSDRGGRRQVLYAGKIKKNPLVSKWNWFAEMETEGLSYAAPRYRTKVASKMFSSTNSNSSDVVVGLQEKETS